MTWISQSIIKLFRRHQTIEQLWKAKDNIYWTRQEFIASLFLEPIQSTDVSKIATGKGTFEMKVNSFGGSYSRGTFSIINYFVFVSNFRFHGNIVVMIYLTNGL